MPALDAISFRPVASVGRRLVLLRHREVRVAGGVGGRPAKRIGAAPLLTVVGTAGPYPIAFERSVRGISSWRPESLSGAWLGLIGRG